MGVSQLDVPTASPPGLTDHWPLPPNKLSATWAWDLLPEDPGHTCLVDLRELLLGAERLLDLVYGRLSRQLNSGIDDAHAIAESLDTRVLTRSWYGKAADGYEACRTSVKTAIAAAAARYRALQQRFAPLYESCQTAGVNLGKIIMRFITRARALQLQVDAATTNPITLGAGLAAAAELAGVCQEAYGKALAEFQMVDEVARQVAEDLRRDLADSSLWPTQDVGGAGLPIPAGIGRWNGRARSLQLERTGKRLQITGDLAVVGDKVNQSHATAIQERLNRDWTTTFADGSSIDTRVTVRAYPAGQEPPPGTAKIVFDQPGAVALPEVSYLGDAHLLSKLEHSPEGAAESESRAFGRQLGLAPALTLQNVPLHGYETRAALEEKGLPSAQTLRDLVDQQSYHGTDPIDTVVHAVQQYIVAGDPILDADDDRAAAFVDAHTDEQLGQLPENDRIAAAHSLLSGYVSDRDRAAARRLLDTRPGGH